MNTTQLIRNEVKALGYTPKQVSVRQHNRSVDVIIKDFTANYKALERLRKYERVRRCEATHEVLCGGNTFVSISYDWKREADIKKTPDYLSFLNGIISKLSEIEGNSGVALSPNIAAFKNQNNGRYQLSVKWEDTPWVLLSNEHDVAWYVYLNRLQGKN